MIRIEARAEVEGSSWQRSLLAVTKRRPSCRIESEQWQGGHFQQWLGGRFQTQRAMSRPCESLGVEKWGARTRHCIDPDDD
jgi:hypothetical protein